MGRQVHPQPKATGPSCKRKPPATISASPVPPTGEAWLISGWQDGFALEEENGNEWRFSRPPRTKLREYYELGLRTANLTYQLSNQFGGGMLDPERG
jgi:hypothetical protein